MSLLTPFLVIPEPPPVSAFAAVMASPASVVTRVVTKLVSSTTPTSTLRAAPQGGVLEGGNPSHYDPKNPIILFIIQVCGPCTYPRYWTIRLGMLPSAVGSGIRMNGYQTLLPSLCACILLLARPMMRSPLALCSHISTNTPNPPRPAS